MFLFDYLLSYFSYFTNCPLIIHISPCTKFIFSKLQNITELNCSAVFGKSLKIQENTVSYDAKVMRIKLRKNDVLQLLYIFSSQSQGLSTKFYSSFINHPVSISITNTL